jgi:hypothetical protein
MPRLKACLLPNIPLTRSFTDLVLAGYKPIRRRKLCDVLIHGDHLSVYVRNVTPADDDTGLAVGGNNRFVHT